MTDAHFEITKAATFDAAHYLEQGPAFVKDYGRLLRSCGSAPVAEVAASVGIDVRDPAFWRSSLEVIRQDIDLFCSLAGIEGPEA